MTRVLVVGPPRSGTTWIGQTLGRARDACYVHEPDGDYEPFALKVKRGGPRHVELRPGDEAPEFERLWAGAFAGGRRGGSLRARVAERYFDATPRGERRAARRGDRPPFRLSLALALAGPLRPNPEARHVVVKSVQSCLAVEWIAAKFDPTVVVVDRHPLNALASWDELNQGIDPVEYAQLRDVARARWGVELPDSEAPRIARQAAFLGVLSGAIHEAARRHPAWLRVRHEDLLGSPETCMADLCARAGLQFSEASAAYLRDSNQPGEGFATKRVASALAQRWRERLSDEQVALARESLQRFPSHLALLDAVGEEAS